MLVDSIDLVKLPEHVGIQRVDCWRDLRHLCRDWQDAAHCQFHFEWQHGQSGVTLERLQERLQALGGLEMREIEEGPYAPGPTFVTNNFRHR